MTDQATRLEFPLPADAAGRSHSITAFRYGPVGTGPKAYLQAGLHADEFPGMLALLHLRGLLDRAAAQDRILGQIVIVPQANPLGLTQHDHGFLLGRAETGSGQNFNRNYADLAAMLPALTLGADADANVALIRAALGRVLAAMRPTTALQALRHRVLTLAHDADLVLDLHADNQALPHLYTGTPLWPDASDIAAAIGARAVLLARVSGGNPFDEALSGPWWTLAQTYPDHPVPPACLAATLEMGSNDDVDAALAERQAQGLFALLARRGLILAQPLPDLPPLRCQASDLTAMAQVKSPATGLVIYHAALGDSLRRGEPVATICDPLGSSVEVLAPTDGLLFARHSQPYAWPDKVIAKIAGTQNLSWRQGLLLTD